MLCGNLPTFQQYLLARNHQDVGGSYHLRNVCTLLWTNSANNLEENHQQVSLNMHHTPHIYIHFSKI